MKNILILISLLVFFSSCREDMDIVNQTNSMDSPPVVLDDYNPDENIITGSISGLVIDENNEPIADAIINLLDETYTTDEDGYFLVKDINLDAEGTFYTVTKAGFFKGSRRFYPKAGNISNTRVQLMALNDIGQFPSADGATVTGTDGISITFPANGIMNSDGTPYSGPVTVAAKWLDPTASNVGDLMPGSLFGVNQQIEEVSLATYGMMAVELFGPSGESLNIADGKTAELSFPVPDELIASAPDEIPLWSFEDAQYGVWVEEGSATLEGDRYVGSVSHFSFWNCDAPFPIIFIEGRLVDALGNPIADASVEVTIIGGGGVRYGMTDSDGYFSGKMPKDRILSITIGSYNSNTCDFSTSEIGPYDVDTNVGDLVLVNSGDAFTVSGTIVDCSGVPVSNGRVKVTVGNRLTTIYTETDGSFSSLILNCDNDIEFFLKGDDLDNQVGSSLAQFTVAPDVNVGNIMACGNNITEFITLEVNGETNTFGNAELFFEIPADGSFMFLNIPNIDSMGNNLGLFTLQMQSGAVGTYSSAETNLDFNISPPEYTDELSLSCQGACADILTLTVNITLYEGIGGNQEGNLTGTANFTDDLGMLVPNVPFSANWRLPIN